MKEKLFNISKIALWVLLFVNLIAFLAFTSKKQSNLNYKETFVTIEEGDHHDAFVNPYDIVDELLDTLNLITLEGSPIASNKPSVIEKILYKNPYIKKAVVYSDVPGNLYISITQKTPIARVVTRDIDYYITKEGSKMPWCKQYTARVPLVTGEFYEGITYRDSMISEKGREVYKFLCAIDTSEFYKAFCDQLFYSQDNPDLKMIPKVGNNVIIFGDASELSDKLNKLRVFYSKVLNNGTLYKYKSINLKFRNQIVCEKHDLAGSLDTSN